MTIVYMNHFLLASKDQNSVECIKNKLNNEYNIKDISNIKMVKG